MYYLLIVCSVVLFGSCFALTDVYRKLRGSSLKISLQSVLIGSLSGLLVMLLVSGFSWEFTPFTLVLAIANAFLSFTFSFCSFRALGTINLSLYSLFSMLGGMMLPFVQGILFYGEKITVSKAICFVLICIALLCTVERGEQKNGTVYYVGIFLLNGLSGVFAKWFSSGGFSTSTQGIFQTTSSAGYTVWCALCSIVLSALLLFLFFRKQDAGVLTWKSSGVAAASGAINRVANFLLVIALAHVDTSVQYPMVTGGTMIVSTVICFLQKNTPKKRELVSVALAFIGLLCLFLIPV